MYFIGVAQLQLYDYSTLPLLCFTSLASSCKQNNICISVPRGYYIMHFAEVIYYRWHLKEQNHIFFLLFRKSVFFSNLSAMNVCSIFLMCFCFTFELVNISRNAMDC